MTVVRIDWTDYPPDDFRGGAITIGNFDGVHLGHQSLIQKANTLAISINGPSVAVTFDPPPLAILNPSAVKPPLSTIDQRIDWLMQSGIDRVVILKTNAALTSLSPEAFFEDVIVRQLDAKAIIEGSDFRFGRKREGDVLRLTQFCNRDRIQLAIMPPVAFDDSAVSSSRVRQALLDGEIEHANALLSRPYSITGIVIEGARRGRTLNFPTANLDQVVTLLPAIGVYAVRVKIGDHVFAGAANIGPNPTFGEDERKIEIYIIDFSGDLYGQSLTVEFMQRIRETKKFDSIETLKQQLANDVEIAKSIVQRSFTSPLKSA